MKRKILVNVLRTKKREKNNSYEEGYQKGVEYAAREFIDVVKKRFYFSNMDQSTKDILLMLFILHTENVCIMNKLDMSEIAKLYNELIENDIPSYKGYGSE